jgi:hypothetical protein
LLFGDAVVVTDTAPDAVEVRVVLETAVTDPELDPKVVAPGPVQVVTVAFAVATPPL